jgi:germination protein M
MARKKSSIGVLFWIACILLILVVFLFNRTRIERVLDSTGFTNFISRQPGRDTLPEVQVSPVTDPGGESIGNTVKPTESRGTPATGTDRDRTGTGTTSPETVTLPEQQTPTGGTGRDGTTPQVTGTDRQGGTETQGASGTGTSRPTGTGTAESKEPQRIRNARLYFVLVEDSGRINLKSVPRQVRFTDSPLTSTLKTLLAGPNHEDIGSGLMSLIPQGTTLISAHVQGDTAFLNFDESFRFNPLGMDGYIAQLRQIIYTATEFSNVKRVQFLIEGEKLEYLTAEGLWIGSPLDRNSL